MMTENKPRVSAYDFFALLKKYKAFDDYIAAFSSSKGNKISLHEFLKSNPPTSWISGAFTWSEYSINGATSWINRRPGWNALNTVWRLKLDPNYRP